MKDEKKIIIAAGGTGGHVFPAVCLAKELKSKGYNITFATDKRGLKYLGNFQNNAIIQKINTSSRLKLYFSLLFNVISKMFHVKHFKPKLVIGFGGYPSVPFVLAAQLLSIKTIIHEQNAVIGKANKLLSKMANLIITSFPKTKGITQSNKVLYLGNPTRFEDKYQNITYSENDIVTILIFGGSQGAKVFSNEVVHAICDLSKTMKLRVFHQGRTEDIDIIKSKYSAFGIENIVSDFFNNMDELYKNSDIVISRSGASSVFEIIGFAKPAILIPYMSSINGDQLANANYLRDNNAVIVVDENADLKYELARAFSKILKEKLEIQNNLKRLQIFDTTKKFAEVIEKRLYN